MRLGEAAVIFLLASSLLLAEPLVRAYNSDNLYQPDGYNSSSESKAPFI
ncbi:MAG: hypothetical protein FWC60_01765 [Firmicutes bacterium]|nr:hypothetical protein [Bacillota bacterium]